MKWPWTRCNKNGKQDGQAETTEKMKRVEEQEQGQRGWAPQPISKNLMFSF